MTVDNTPVSGSIFDFALYFFHNARELVRRGSGPYFYLPKMEHYKEARLWNDIFTFSQNYITIPQGTIRGTVLIETLPAAFHMEEILFELREHSSGLNCGRWDYIFSFIKRRRADLNAVLPDRVDVTMEVAFMDAYVRKLIQTCHKWATISPLLSAKPHCLIFSGARSLPWAGCQLRSPSRITSKLTRSRWAKYVPTSLEKLRTATTERGSLTPSSITLLWKFSTSICWVPTKYV